MHAQIKFLFLAHRRSEASGTDHQPRINKKFKLNDLLENSEKTQENFKHSDLKIKKFEEIQVLYEKIKRFDEDFISIGSAEDERLIKKINEKGVDSSKGEKIKVENKEEVNEGEYRRREVPENRKQDEEKEVDYEILDMKYPIKEWKTECFGTKPQTDKAEHLEEINQNVLDCIIVSWKLHSSSEVHTLVTDTRLVIHMLVQKKYPLKKEVLVQMLKLKLESEEDSTMALELIRFIKKLLAELEPEE
ncbi:hypothetical protein Tco_0563802 [Tanacetum coccineum]